MKVGIHHGFIYKVVLLLKALQIYCFEENSYLHHLQRRAQCGDSACKKPVIKSYPKNISVSIGIPKTLKCRAQGNPLPTIIWEKNDVRIDPENTNFRISSTKLKNGKDSRRKSKVVRSLLVITNQFDKSIKYITCSAINSMGRERSPKSFVIYKSTSSSINPENIPGSSKFIDPMKEDQCVNITGTVCSKYLDPDRFIYSSHGLPRIHILEDALKELSRNFEGENDHISPTCKPYALPFLCYYNFGYCEKVKGKPRKVQICKKDCISLKRIKCYAEFLRAKEDETLQELLPKTCDVFSDNNCISMEKEMERVAKKSVSQQSMFGNRLENKEIMINQIYSQKVPHNSLIDPADNCFFEKGQYYRGTRNYTETNKPCRFWKDTRERTYADLFAHNYCRNPGTIRERPWCYVTVSNGRYQKEYCSLPTCATPIRSPTTNILYAIIPCLIFALAFSLAIIALAWRRHKQHYYESTPDSPKQVAPLVSPKIQELNREDLCDFCLMGDAFSGRIYTADYTGIRDGRTISTCVAVKTIIEKANQKQIEDFIREAETRANFKHENILTLIGVISQEEPLSLIYEYYENGDLHEYLLRHSPNFSDAHADDNCQPLEHNDLLMIGTQIASGMSYLSTHAFVHKDLAARNCLVTANGIIKITDISGISDMYAGDYYREPGKVPIPVRWMSPESISHTVFSTSSDVWSYGVLLWEIFSYGNRPYFGLSNAQAMQQILNYETLVIPYRCPLPIFTIMEKCWQTEAPIRPTFFEIYNQLKILNDKLFNGPLTTPNHQQQTSMRSLRSSNSINRDAVTHGVFNRNSLSNNSQHRSMHSSDQSIESSHPPASSMRSHDILPPHSATDISLSISPPMNGHIHPIRSSHHSLPKDIRYAQAQDKFYMLPPNGHRSLPRDTHFSTLVDNHRPLQPSQNQYNNNNHQMNQRGVATPSYASTMQSYPNSLSYPPVSFLSRQSSSRSSSQTPSGKSNGRQEALLSASNGSHVYL